MSILIPEQALHRLIEACLVAVKVDYDENTANEQNSMLYKFFGGIPQVKNKFDWFVQAKDLFLRGDRHPRAIDVNMFFNSKRASIPTIHITLPSEMSKDNGLGVDAGYQDPLYSDDDTSYQEVHTRMFDAQYQILITSDNTLEVQLIYNFMRAMFISTLDKIDLAGLRNPTLSGQDLRIDSTLIPENIFVRGLGINVNYEIDVPEFVGKQVIKQLEIGNTTMIDK